MKLGLSSTLITSEPCLASRSFEALNWDPGIRLKASLEKRRSNRRLLSSRSHHVTRQLYGFIVSGRLQLEYFLRRQEIADLNVGDFFHIPAGLVHRDLNPNKVRELVVVNILVGSGPAVINVDSPPKESR